MKTYNASDLLVSIHLPKCGGSSLKAALKSWFGNKLHYHYYDEENNSMPSRLESYRIRASSLLSTGHCVHGHFNKYRGFGIRDYYPQSKQFISFLRDPLEIHLSNYYFVKNKVLYRDGERFHFKMDVNEYLNDVIDNASSWYMTHFPDDICEDSIPEYIEERFVFIGVMEDYQKSLDVLADILEKPRFEIPVYNKTERDPYVLDEDLVSRFKEAFGFDYKVYDYANRHIQSS